MIRLGMMLAAVLLMATAGNPIRAKITMQTFPVSAGAGAHDASRAGRRSLVVAANEIERFVMSSGGDPWLRLGIDHFDTVLRLASTAMGLGCQPMSKMGSR